MATGVRGVNRILDKLQKSLDSKSYYEAHQMYRTLYHRYCAQEKYIDALDLMYEGASSLFSFQQEKSGADLSLLYLEIIEKHSISLNECHIKRISDLFSHMRNGTPERHQFLVKAIRLSTDTNFKFGNPKLHLSIGRILWKEKNYSSASYHFLRSDNGLECGAMLVELHLLQGYPTEVDLFIAQAVLQYLCLQKKKEADQVFDAYTQKHPSIQTKTGPYLLPLLNFLWLLLKAIDNRKVSQFNTICEKYKPTLKRDPVYTEYLSKIGHLFFDIPAPRVASSSGLLGNWLEGIFSSLAEDDAIEDDVPDLD